MDVKKQKRPRRTKAQMELARAAGAKNTSRTRARKKNSGPQFSEDWRQDGYMHGDEDIKTPDQLRDEIIRLTEEIRRRDEKDAMGSPNNQDHKEEQDPIAHRKVASEEYAPEFLLAIVGKALANGTCTNVNLDWKNQRFSWDR